MLTFREAFGFEGGVPPHPRPHSAKVFRNNSGPCGPTRCPQQAEPNSTKPTNTQRESELPSFSPRQLCRWSVVHQDPPTLRPATSPEQVGLIHVGVCLPVDTPKRRPSDKVAVIPTAPATDPGSGAGVGMTDTLSEGRLLGLHGGPSGTVGARRLDSDRSRITFGESSGSLSKSNRPNFSHGQPSHTYFDAV